MMKKYGRVVFLPAAVFLMLFLQACAMTAPSDADPPKYVFLLIGDGMGPNQIRLAREFGKLSMDTMPVRGELRTDNVFGKTTDSAAAATALACGVKTYNGAIGLDKDGKPVESSAALAKRNGRGVGLLTSVTFNHATPGAFYAHVPKRSEYAEIAAQACGAGYDLIMGYGVSVIKGETVVKDAKKAGLAVFHQDQDAFFALHALLRPTLVFKQFGYEMDRRPDTDDSGRTLNEAVELLSVEHPSAVLRTSPYASGGVVRPLNEYAAKAIDLLYKNNPKGFFLMIEGGKIDVGAHANNTYAAMTELLEFDRAVGRALDFYRRHPEDTLIVVTADHDTGGLMLPETLPAGIAEKIRENHVRFNGRTFSFRDDETLQSVREKLAGRGIANLTARETESFEKILKSKAGNKRSQLNRNALRIADARLGVTWTSKGHTAQNVFLFAIGRNAGLFSGVRPNSDVGRIMKSFYEKH